MKQLSGELCLAALGTNGLFALQKYIFNPKLVEELTEFVDDVSHLFYAVLATVGVAT